MTVVAIYRGENDTHNTMVVDTVRTDTDRPESWTDKLSRLFDDTYVTAVGDGELVPVVREVVAYLDPLRPDLRDPQTIDSVLSLLERVFLLRERAGAPHRSKGSVLFVCTRRETYFWLLLADDEGKRFVRPTAPIDLDDGTCVVFWGSTRYDLKAPNLGDGSPGAIIRAIEHVDRDARAKGKRGLPYALEGPFSSVLVPHDPSVHARRARPFSLPELIVRETWPDQLAVLQEPEFANLTLPPTL